MSANNTLTLQLVLDAIPGASQYVERAEVKITRAHADEHVISLADAFSSVDDAC